MTEDKLGRTRPGRHRAAWLALAIALASVLLNVFLIIRLSQARDATLQLLDEGLQVVDDLAANGLELNIPISQTLRISESLPLKLDLDFPVRANFPINTDVNIPIDLGALGSRNVRVPINTTVPVSLSVPVHIDQRFPVNLPLSIQITVPLKLDPREPPLKDWLARAREELTNIRREIEGDVR